LVVFVDMLNLDPYSHFCTAALVVGGESQKF